MMKVTFE